MELIESSEIDSSVDDSVNQGIHQTQISDYIFTPETISNLNATSKCIIDELRAWHTKLGKHGNLEIHPSYFLTLEKLQPLLQKYNNLSEQAKSPESINISIKQLMDYNGKGANRYIYIYPFLLRQGNKMVAKIAIIAPQKEPKTNVRPYRQSCFDYSKELIDVFIANRSKKNRLADSENPVSLLHESKFGLNWYFPNLLSVESEIKSIIKKGFKPFQYLSIPDFINDFIAYCKEKNSIVEILPTYHLIKDHIQVSADGTFKITPEIFGQLKLHMVAFETFCVQYLTTLAERAGYVLFQSRLKEFRENTHFGDSSDLDKSISRIESFIDLVETFPFEKESDSLGRNVADTISTGIKIIKRLIKEKNNINLIKEGYAQSEYNQEIIKNISTHTKDQLTLFEIKIPEEKQKKNKSIHEEKTQKMLEEIGKKFKVKLVQENNESKYYTVDHGYLAAVIHKLHTLKLKNPKYEKDLQIALEIHDELSNPKDPNLNSKLKPELIVRLMQDVREMEKEATEKKRTLEFAKKFNINIGLMGTVSFLILFLLGSFLLNTFTIFFVGIPFSLIVGIILAILFREKNWEQGEKDEDNSSVEIVTENDETDQHDEVMTEGKEKKIHAIYKQAENIIYPKHFNNIKDKFYDLHSLREKINLQIEEIKKQRFKSNEEKEKEIANVEYAVLQNSAQIAIPDDIVPKNHTNNIIVSHKDLKSPLVREQISEHFRDLLEKNRFDKKMLKYYTFLINTFEMEYYKYLPAKFKK